METALNKHRSKRKPHNSNAKLVLSALQEDPRPHSAYELVDKLRDAGISAPATVYRALGRLIDAGSVHRLESLNAYVACTGGHCQEDCDAAFAICDDCGSVEELADAAVVKAAAAWAKNNTFMLSATTLELRGVCKACRITPDSCAIGQNPAAWLLAHTARCSSQCRRGRLYNLQPPDNHLCAICKPAGDYSRLWTGRLFRHV